MRGHAFIRSTIVAAGILGIVSGLQPAMAAPLAPATRLMSPTSVADLTQVRWRGHGGGGAGLAAGLATGLIIGGLLAAPRYDEPYVYYYPRHYAPRYYGPIYYAPVGDGGPGWESYCFSRYRSFDPISGTYLGYDGRRHACR